MDFLLEKTDEYFFQQGSPISVRLVLVGTDSTERFTLDVVGLIPELTELK